MKKTFLFSLFSIGFLFSYAQIGGRFAFESSNLPSNARVTALGGLSISVMDDDVATAQGNPALSNIKMNNQLGVNHSFFYSGISHGNVSFGKTMDTLGMSFHAAIQYVNYGDFILTDEIGREIGEFSANEIGFILGAAKQLNERLRAGINLKILSATYESYNAFGLGLDLGLVYKKPGSGGQWGIVLKNIGGELDALVDSKRSLPFELQIGYSKRLKHLPFRISITGQQLQKWYIRYDDPDLDASSNLFGEVNVKSEFSKQVDNFFRHFVFAGEFLIGRSEQFRIRFAYNHLRKQELKTSSFRSFAGFSFGIGFNIKKIKIDYGLGYYHLEGASNHLSIRLNMDRIFNKI